MQPNQGPNVFQLFNNSNALKRRIKRRCMHASSGCWRTKYMYYINFITGNCGVHVASDKWIPSRSILNCLSQWRKSGSKSGGTPGRGRRAELRVEASRPVGLRGGRVLGEGDMPPPHQLGIMGEHCKLPQWGPGRSPGDLAIFVDFGTQEVILHRESKKGCHPKYGYNFVNSWWICKILSLLERPVNLQQNR